MPEKAHDSYTYLKQAQELVDGLPMKGDRQAQYADLRLAFHYMYEAMRCASMSFEVGCGQGGAAQGGMYSWAKDELGSFLAASTKCHVILDGASSADDLMDAIKPWMMRAQSYIEKLNAFRSFDKAIAPHAFEQEERERQ